VARGLAAREDHAMTAMATTLAETPVTGPVDSLEVRWMFPGPAGTAVREWLARFPGTTETRKDSYLLRPRLPGLSVKLRGGSSLDVKSCLGSPGILGLPRGGCGRLESWRKWSFPCDPPGRDDAPPDGWGIVRKRRRRTWFPLAAGHDPARAVLPAVQAGCAVELTQVRIRGEPWWSVGFEATGSASLLRCALDHAADLVFATPPPDGIELSLDNSRSYAQWLSLPEVGFRR
jgi:hypothetical protein